MRNNSTYFKVGMFVLGCAAILIAGVVFISADKINDAIMIETYIDESVQGLSVGSSVVRRGVAIGRVERITFVPVEYPMEMESIEFGKFERYVMVVMAIRPTEFPQLGKDPELVSATLRQQVNNGLRFKISYQGITGLAYLEADYVDPLRNPPLAVPWKPKNHYIPSTPSVIQNFTEALDKTFQRIGAMDVEGLVDKMESLMGTLEVAVQDANIKEIRESVTQLADDFSETNTKLQSLLDEAGTIPEDFSNAVEQFNQTLAKIEFMINEHEPDIDTIMTNVNYLTENVRHLSETLKSDPAKIFLSKPPKRSEIVE